MPALRLQDVMEAGSDNAIYNTYVPFSYYKGKKFQFNSKAHGDATLICEQGCLNALLTMELDDGASAVHFSEYFTYVRGCMEENCHAIPALRTQNDKYLRPPWHYHPKQTKRPLVPFGSSLNRVVDLVVRTGYQTIMFAGCDGTSAHLGLNTTHSTLSLGYREWGMGISEFIAGFLRYNGVRYYSLTSHI